MGSLFRLLLQNPLTKPIVRPFARFLVGALAIPLFRLFLRRVVRLQEMDAELEKDLEHWFRGALLLLAATANMEDALFGWVPPRLTGTEDWILIGFRLLLAISVVEAMPDQELFAVIHPGPPKLHFRSFRTFVAEIRDKRRAIVKGHLCQHLNRSSPVFAILAAIAPGTVGWVCYTVAITQYLIIGLVTSRDRALDVLSVFDRAVAERRREIIEEFHIGSGASVAKPAEPGYDSVESRRDADAKRQAEQIAQN